ncbi:MAG: hypothetical protein J1E02_07320 [Coprobacter sp.]|nr:hypothetical protein [Coprobacter sp.]
MAIEFVNIEDLTRIPGSELTGTGECVQVSATEKTTVADIAEFTRLEMERSGCPVYRLKGGYYFLYSGASGVIVSQAMDPDGGFSALVELTRKNTILLLPGEHEQDTLVIFRQQYNSSTDNIEWEFFSRNYKGEPVLNRIVMNSYRFTKTSTSLVSQQVVLPSAFADFSEESSSSEILSALLEAGHVYDLEPYFQEMRPFYIRCSDGLLVRLLSLQVSSSNRRITYSFIHDTLFCRLTIYEKDSVWKCERSVKSLV